MFSGSVESLQATWQSTTVPVKPLSHDRLYYFLPYWDEKPTVYIRSGFPDHRRRMYNSNAITKIADKVVRNHAQIIENFSHFDEGLEVLIPSITKWFEQGGDKIVQAIKGKCSPLALPFRNTMVRRFAWPPRRIISPLN